MLIDFHVKGSHFSVEFSNTKESDDNLNLLRHGLNTTINKSKYFLNPLLNAWDLTFTLSFYTFAAPKYWLLRIW